MLQSIPPRDYFLEIMTNGQLWSNPCFPGHVITGKTRVKIMVTGSFPRDLLTPTILGTHSLLEVSFPHSFKRTPGRSPLRPAILGAPLPLGSWAVLCHWGCRAWELLPPWGGGALLCQRHGPGSARDPGSWVAVPSITPGHLSRLRLERWGRLLPRLGHRAARIQIRASTP